MFTNYNVNQQAQQQLVGSLHECLDEKYQVIQKIGYGAYGQVYMAMHRQNGTMHAIKHIPYALIDGTEAKKACREVQIMRNLSKKETNNSTVKLHEVIIPAAQSSYQSPNQNAFQSDLFLVEEHFGTDIQTVIQNRQALALTEQHIKIVTLNMLLAANYLHKQNIVHRDLKPGNVLINADCNIKFCDFGLARTIPLRKEMSPPMSPRVGSRFYRAPELILNDPKYDYGIDIWAIGCILGELLLNFVERAPAAEQSSKDPTDFSDTFLFPGDSCFPISPCK